VAKTKGKTRGASKSTPRAAPKAARAKPVKPPRPTRPSLPAPPAPPPAPLPRDELIAPRDIGRLTRYGERFGATKIDTRLLQHIQLPVGSGQIAVFDPGAPKSWRVLDRPVGSGFGMFRVMLSVARDDAGGERLAAIVIHVGRPPIARWAVAHYRGQKKPRSAEQLPRCPVTTGWIAVMDAGTGEPAGVIAVPASAAPGQPVEIPLTDGRRALALPCGNGEYAAYWAVDAADKPICLVLDFDVFSAKDWKARPPAP